MINPKYRMHITKCKNCTIYIYVWAFVELEYPASGWSHISNIYCNYAEDKTLVAEPILSATNEIDGLYIARISECEHCNKPIALDPIGIVYQKDTWLHENTYRCCNPGKSSTYIEAFPIDEIPIKLKVFNNEDLLKLFNN